MHESLPEHALSQLFLDARTHREWLPNPVTPQILHRLYELVRLAPTTGNMSPGRFLFVQSLDGKQRLKPALDAGNVDKTMTAPVTVVIAHDVRFPEYIPRLNSYLASFQGLLEGNPTMAATLASMNSSIEGAYLIIAARALGLDVGPMGGFDAAKVDAAFFPDGRWKSNFLVNLGYGDASKLFPRLPRLEFDEACKIV